MPDPFYTWAPGGRTLENHLLMVAHPTPGNEPSELYRTDRLGGCFALPIQHHAERLLQRLAYVAENPYA